jgi:hypothetical protein
LGRVLHETQRPRKTEVLGLAKTLDPTYGLTNT